MEKKENFWHLNPLRTFSGFRNIFGTVFGGKYPSKSNASIGFTLIELLVGIAIIGVLAGSAFFVLNPGAQFAKARDAQRKSDLQQIANALDAYYSDYNVYPGVGQISRLAIRKYLRKLPADPSSGAPYVYEPEPKNVAGSPCSSACSSYRLYTKLERCSDVQGVIGVDCQRTDKEYSVNSSNLSAPELMPPPQLPGPGPVDPAPPAPPPIYDPDPGFWFW